jgi:hypothetical protein
MAASLPRQLMMIELQVQAVVPSQSVEPPLCRHTKPEQHAFDGEHAWPPLAHVAVWQMPLFEPVGMTHWSPLQQSPPLVHAPFVPIHTAGVWQVPFKHVDEQHSEELVQAAPFPLHEVTMRHVAPNSSERHCPEQQVLPPSPGVHAAPSAVQLLPALQRRTPLWSGTQGAPPQHWSLNWQISPVSMQQGARPVYPVGHCVLPPPKHRGMPALSRLQTSLCPSQQSWGALTLNVPPSGRGKGAPQMLPTGLQACPWSQRP